MKLRMALLLVGLPLGLAALGLTNPNAGAQTETVLYSFGSSPNDGAGPNAALVQGSDRNLYGTTVKGGTNSCFCGTVFRISASGSYTGLYSFAGYPIDGAGPDAALVQGSDGNLYGTTLEGGTCTNCQDEFGDIVGCGTVFRISLNGSYTNLYQFGSTPGDGVYPRAGLVQGSDGIFYGTTAYGGTSTNCRSYGCGTVFRISPTGTYTNLYSFGSSPNDGANPNGRLVQGSDGNFYGTTAHGGTNDYGTVFRISPSGNKTTLYSFGRYPTDGDNPYAGLVQGSDGNFYGTTAAGGTGTCCGNIGGGTVFRISISGTYTSLYSLGSSGNDGFWETDAGLVQGSDGNFYGTTQSGVFRIGPSGGYTNVYAFAGPPTDGRECNAGLVQGSDGSFYGTTILGGTNINYGTVFKLTVPLSPPANQISGMQFFNVLDSTIVALAIPSVASETYQLQYTDSMPPGNWINTGGTITSIGGPLVLINLAEPLPPQRFYRAAITP